jgi:hypothetical protein
MLAPDGTPVTEPTTDLHITGLTAVTQVDPPYRHSTAAARWSTPDHADAS